MKDQIIRMWAVLAVLALGVVTCGLLVLHFGWLALVLALAFGFGSTALAWVFGTAFSQAHGYRARPQKDQGGEA
jgi:O-antigen/teichoic acid export membrane protein